MQEKEATKQTVHIKKKEKARLSKQGNGGGCCGSSK